VLTHCTWKLEKLQCLFEGDAFDELSRSKACVLPAVSVSLLYIWSVLAETCGQRLSVIRVDAEFAAHMAVLLVAEGVLHLRMERTIEVADHAVPCKLALCDLVEILLHVGGESIVEDGLEVLHEVVGDDHSDVLRKETALLRSDGLGLCCGLDDSILERKVGHVVLFARLVALDDVSASLCEGRDCRGICGWTADAELFELLHKCSLRVAGRRCREFAFGGNALLMHDCAYVHFRKDHHLVIL